MHHFQYQNLSQTPSWQPDTAAIFQPSYLPCADHWTNLQPAPADDSFSTIDCVLRAAFPMPAEKPGWSFLLLAQLGGPFQEDPEADVSDTGFFEGDFLDYPPTHADKYKQLLRSF